MGKTNEELATRGRASLAYCRNSLHNDQVFGGQPLTPRPEAVKELGFRRERALSRSLLSGEPT